MKRLIWNRHTKLVLKHAVGWLCIAMGIIQGFLPFLQGWIFILLGVFLLADEIPLFGKLKAWLQHRFPKTADHVHHMGGQIRKKFHSHR